MLPEIEIFIKDTYTPELQEVINRGFEFIDKIVDGDFEQGFLEILMIEDTLSPHDAFYGKLLNLIFEIATSFEITFNQDDNLMLSTMIDILEAVSDIDAYMDKESILLALDSSDDNIDSLAQVINITANIEVTTTYQYIDNVSVALIKKIKQISKQGDPVIEVVDNQSYNNKIVELKTIRKYLTDILEYPNPIGLQLISEGVSLSCEFATYLPYLKNRLDITDPKSVACELFFLFKMSNNASQNIIEFFRNNSSDIFDDITKTTKVDVELGKLINGFLSATVKAPQANAQN